MIDRPSHVRTGVARLLRFAFILFTALAVSACAQGDGSDFFGSLRGNETRIAPSGDMDPAQAVAYYSSRYAAQPKDKYHALNYAKALRKVGNNKRALSVLQAASGHHKNDPQILSAYGRAALAAGQTKAAIGILAKADDPARPDWRTVSARGTAYAKIGNYQQAIYQFERALKLAPQNPSVMNNLAMAKAANGDLKAAETLLRNASQMPIIDTKVKKNLALVLRLQGRNKDARALEVEISPASSPALAIRETVTPDLSSGDTSKRLVKANPS